MSTKLGRNDPCWCGSGKKYKNCHLRQDETERRTAQAVPPAAPHPLPAQLAPSPAWADQASPELATEKAADMADMTEAEAVWDEFENADANGKIAIFVEQLDKRALDSHLSFDMLDRIRSETNPQQNAAARARYSELIEGLRRDMPDVYHQNRPYYLSNLISDAITDQRLDALPPFMAEFAQTADQNIDEFFQVIETMLYHGQTRPLFAAMEAAWQTVAHDDGVTPQGIDEFSGILMLLVFYHYLQDTESPHADDPSLIQAMSQYGSPRIEWFARAISCLLASSPSAWQIEDFGPAVDAERWEDNLSRLLFEFMADLHRQSGVPWSKGNLARDKLWEVLYQQFSEGTAASGGKVHKSRRSSSPLRSSPPSKKRVSGPLASMDTSSPLVPQYQVLDRLLGQDLGLLGGQPYKVGATMELLPAFLHFLARLGLIHPAEMDRALDHLGALATAVMPILNYYEVDGLLRHAIELAWADETLNGLRQDPSLAAARARPPIVVSLPIETVRSQTYTFKVSYQPQPDAWFIIEMRGEQTLHQLHRTILDVADFDEDHLYAFYMSGRAWDDETEYAIYDDARHSSNIPIRDLRLRMKQRFLYLYDFGDEHCFDVQLVATSTAAPVGRHPKIIEQHGKIPPQYGDWDDEEEWDGEEEWDDDEEEI